MRIAFSIRLPVDAQSIPLVRGLVRQTLQELGAVSPWADEILLALSEACANVVQHAGAHEDYQVDVTIDDHVCRLVVLDHGEGFDLAAADDARSRSPLDTGSGVALMTALVDRLDFRRTEDGRHGVLLEKRLVTSPRLRLLPT